MAARAQSVVSRAHPATRVSLTRFALGALICVGLGVGLGSIVARMFDDDSVRTASSDDSADPMLAWAVSASQQSDRYLALNFRKLTMALLEVDPVPPALTLGIERLARTVLEGRVLSGDDRAEAARLISDAIRVKAPHLHPLALGLDDVARDPAVVPLATAGSESNAIRWAERLQAGSLGELLRYHPTFLAVFARSFPPALYAGVERLISVAIDGRSTGEEERSRLTAAILQVLELSPAELPLRASIPRLKASKERLETQSTPTEQQVWRVWLRGFEKAPDADLLAQWEAILQVAHLQVAQDPTAWTIVQRFCLLTLEEHAIADPEQRKRIALRLVAILEANEPPGHMTRMADRLRRIAGK